MGCGFEQRKELILAELRKNPDLKITQIVDLTGAAVATVRRDILKMEEMNLIVRSFGSIRAVEQKSLVARTFEQRSTINSEAKKRIASAAAQLVSPGMTIVLDSGTTCWNFAAELKDKAPLRIITSALAVVETLGGIPGMEIILVGGHFRIENLDFAGPFIISSFEKYHADIAFLGCDAFLPETGAFSRDAESAAISMAIQKCASKTVLLCDNSKIGISEPFLAMNREFTDIIVTDRNIPELQNSSCQVIVAGVEK